MEKTRLGNDQPDYHSLLAALTQVLDGLLLNAWLRECGFSSFKLFAEFNPSPQTLRDIASRILNYSTPMNTSSHTPEESTSSSESEESESSSEAGIHRLPNHLLNPRIRRMILRITIFVC